MTDIVIPRHSSTLSDFCEPSASLDEYARARRVMFGCQSVAKDYAYCLAVDPNPQDLAISNMLNSLPEKSRQRLGCCVDQHGQDTVRLALFIDWVQSRLNPDNASTGNSVAGIGATVLGARTDSFMNALSQYQDALVKLNNFTRVGRGPSRTKAHLRQNVRSAYERLNRYFQQELSRLAPRSDFGLNKGSAITGADRGVRLAERHKGRGIHVADMNEGRAVSRFSQGLQYAGRGIIVADVGLRANAVYRSYRNEDEWERELVAQTGGLAGATSAGFVTGKTVAMTMARVALAATPWGWGLMIGSAVAIGAYAAYQADERGQNLFGKIYDYFTGD
ncbi:hypothetical protein [Marinobacter sp. AN1]|uniref:hypothetical protein n=1 Tax=Marinobacter sp. AN1 TaxID=2886046 RepID=UPI002232BA04|nr:hypothetical protein [Marinobacter sp. AN1]UZD67458.1 hypothetical protein LJ360_09235 [Marinobacter sp. AN1]